MTYSSVDTNDQISVVECLQFDFDKIKVATQNFFDANKLGEGGFGVVYKVMWHYQLEECIIFFSHNMLNPKFWIIMDYIYIYIYIYSFFFLLSG